VLDAAKLSSVKPARAVFPRHVSGRIHKEPTISGSLMMNEQWRETDVCSMHLVYIAVSNRHCCSFVLSWHDLFDNLS